MKTNISYLIFILLLFIGTPGWGQFNLVLNPSLENYSHCPNGNDQIKFANNWNALDTIWYTVDSGSNPYCSPEYCNICGTTDMVSIPTSLSYYHYPHTGSGMAQVLMFYTDTAATPYKRDYLQGKLRTHLLGGVSYCVSFYVTLEQASTFAINNIGAYLDDGTIDTTGNCGEVQTQYTPQVLHTSIINDTLNWVRVQGSFIATGNEQFITIGNFTDRTHTSYEPAIGRDTTGWGDWHRPILSYTLYLVDDVSVFRSDATANIGPHTHSLSTTATDSLVLGDTLDTYLPTDWYADGVKIDSNKASIKVLPRHNTTYKLALNKCGGAISWDSTFVTVGAGESLGASQLSLSAAVVLAPNPAQNLLNISNAAGAAFAVYDFTGREVLSQKISTNQEAIDISGIEIGVYMIVLTDGQTGEKVVRRVVKE